METIDDEFTRAAIDFIERQHGAGTPFFVWFNTTHMHLRTHTKPESIGQAGRWQSPYHDTMIDHDKHVGAAARRARRARHRRRHHRHLQHRQRAAHEHAGRTAATTPFRSEKNTNWEGAFRVPQMIRWPGQIPAGVVSNEIVSTTTGCPTFLAAARRPGHRGEAARPATQAGGKTFKVHIDGYNLLPYLTGEVEKSPRQGSSTSPTTATCSALRFDNWKIVFMEQRVRGTLQVWAEPFVAPARARRCSTCAPTRSSARTSRRTPTGTGSSTTPSSLCRRRRIVGAVPRDVQGVPAAAEGGQLHHRPGGGEAGGRLTAGR